MTQRKIDAYRQSEAELLQRLGMERKEHFIPEKGA